MEEKIYNKVVVVNEYDAVIGAEYMFDAIEKGMIRRVVRVFVFNESGQLLLQQRSEKVQKPLLFDQSAGGHVDEGETNQTAAERELFEELGLSGVVVREVNASFRTKSFFNASYQVVVPDSTEISFDTEEVKHVFWIEVDQFSEQIKTEPEKFNPTFLEVWDALKSEIIPKK
jgi:isopentenyl-diphosphate delta-isomerase